MWPPPINFLMFYMIWIVSLEMDVSDYVNPNLSVECHDWLCREGLWKYQENGLWEKESRPSEMWWQDLRAAWVWRLEFFVRHWQQYIICIGYHDKLLGPIYTRDTGKLDGSVGWDTFVTIVTIIWTRFYLLWYLYFHYHNNLNMFFIFWDIVLTS